VGPRRRVSGQAGDQAAQLGALEGGDGGHPRSLSGFSRRRASTHATTAEATAAIADGPYDDVSSKSCGDAGTAGPLHALSQRC
jgi:hypothetical protein